MISKPFHYIGKTPLEMTKRCICRHFLLAIFVFLLTFEAKCAQQKKADCCKDLEYTKKRYEEGRKEIKFLRKELSQTRDELTDTVDSLNDCREREDLAKDRELSLEKKLNATLVKIKELQQSLKDCKTEVLDAKDKDIEAKLNLAEQKLHDAYGKLSETENELQAKTKEVDALRQLLEKMDNDKFEDQKNLLQNTIKNQIDIKECNGNLTACLEKNGDLKVQLKQANNLLSEQDKTVKELEEALKLAQEEYATKPDITLPDPNLNAELEETKQKLNETTDLAESLKETIQKGKVELHECNAKLTDITAANLDINNQLTESSEKLEEAAENGDMLKDIIDDLEKKVRECIQQQEIGSQNTAQQLPECQKKLEEAVKREKELQTTIQAGENKIKQCSKKLEESNEQKLNISEDLINSITKMHEAKENATALETALKSVQTELDICNKTLQDSAGAATTITNLTQELMQTKQLLLEALQTAQDLRKTLDKKELELSACNENSKGYEDLKQKCAEKEQELLKIGEQLRDAEAKVLGCEESCKKPTQLPDLGEQDKEVRKLERIIFYVRAQFALKQAELEQIKKTLTALKQRLTHCEKKLTAGNL